MSKLLLTARFTAPDEQERQLATTAAQTSGPRKGLLAILAVIIIGLGALAYTTLVPSGPSAPIYTAASDNLGAGGADTVAYFTDGRRVDGTDEFTTEWRGAEWRFASAEHLAMFEADPERYAPQYGGYCAWALADNRLASGDPDNWNIVDGKLYLNYNDEIEERWKKDIPGFIEMADINWPTILGNG
ncbi:MAG: YHS domain-containing (seleno)protein [Pseudomonadota bacterium]